MNKFTKVFFKPLGVELHISSFTKPSWCCTLNAGDLNFVRFSEDFILENPHLFEVETSQPEYENLEYYWVQRNKSDRPEPAQYFKAPNKFYLIGCNISRSPDMFYKIGGVCVCESI